MGREPVLQREPVNETNISFACATIIMKYHSDMWTEYESNVDKVCG